ncbi:MAG TPA: hypothetical protein VMV27_00090 [Candidatus Binataceae bacterium]|nr:hypothetical protein [Candidatus Binataceae bacterium]
MNESNLAGVESIRIVSVHGNLRVARAASAHAAISAAAEPRIRREGGLAEITLHSSAELGLPAGVALEVAECQGNLELEDLDAPLLLGRVGGNLRARRIGALVIRERVGGNATVAGCGAFECEQIGGSLAIDHASAIVSVRRIGGRLEADAIGAIMIDSVGAKAVVRSVSGSAAIGRVGGRLRLENAGGDVAIDRVDGHGSVSGVRGDLALGRVGGALDLRGPFPAGKTWHALSGGRIEVELDSEASLTVDASARWGRIRLYGIDERGLARAGASRMRGTIGAERAASERTQLNLETRNADIIIARDGAQERDYCGSGRRFAGAFEELGDILSEEFRGEVPAVVYSILGAAGRFVSRGAGLSGRMMAEAGGEASAEIASAVEELRRKLTDEIRRAAEQGRCRTREQRRAARDSIRAAARAMREAIAQAERAARQAPEPNPPPRAGDTRPLDPAAYQGDIMKILHAVKAGELEPEEADEMIAALMEAEGAADIPARG